MKWFVAALGSVWLFGCQESVTIPEPASRPVKLQAVSVGDTDTYRTFPARIEAGDKAVLTFRVSGQLETVAVRPGAVVRRGQALAKLKTDELEQLLEQARANHELASVQFKRDQQLRRTRVISELAYDESKAALSQATAALEQARANLGYATLLAPYDGSLSLSMVENYEYVAAKEPVMHIQSAGLINVTFQLPDHLLARYQSDLDANPKVTFDTLPDQTFPARFKEIDTEADSKTSSYKVTLSMEKPVGHNLLPGMSGQVQISLPSGSSGALPSRAIMHEGKSSYVWRVDADGVVSKVQVTLDAQRRVISGLNDGDLIVTSGVEQLLEGQVVRAWVKERGL
ncbi:efflux RND transporter periplasmic adaptor subunit [Photobacterium sp. TY1-4]|uniref:efflux RND transporter periplasmic adaptor subunit n=1 Tax=Photobacterium sp. TY1-4 TaxID=2899122 RepID=UPI0021BF2A53|nr:efflux RND transporter periplasmic adaptor subunit [Photobacterium sp. TY1-4]UXI02283.1 efflux RND transporter periplasmic adaptor subunit [Photobacterium sp. TY1-4]